ncbi:MAG: hypothetical protein Q9163_002114 [Psora crenata]
MSSNLSSDVTNTLHAGQKAKRSKKKKGGKNRANGTPTKTNGVKLDETHDDDAEEEEAESASSPANTIPPSFPEPEIVPPAQLTNGNGQDSKEKVEDATMEGLARRPSVASQGESKDMAHSQTQALSSDGDGLDVGDGPSTRLYTLSKDREALRQEVAQVRQSLQDLQGKYETETSDLRDQLAGSQEEKETAETQYQDLLGRVNTIRKQLGDRLKVYAEDLRQARTRIEELEDQNSSLRQQNEAREAELAALAEQGEQQSKELSSLRNRTTLSQQNFSKEREELLRREAYAKEEFEAAKQAMQDWEVLAMEERSIRESIAEKVADLEEQVASYRDAHARAAAESDSQSSTIDGLQRALQELQNARRRELREMVEDSQAQVENLQKQLRESESKAAEAITVLESTRQELERALPFEKEVKEKNLLIGKLRHEAVILNDHLTKALRYLKRGKPQDTIDKSDILSASLLDHLLTLFRQLVTNHLMHFLALERGDPKKFQVLQIIANLLGWDDGSSPSAARPWLVTDKRTRTARGSGSGTPRCVKSEPKGPHITLASDTQHPSIIVGIFLREQQQKRISGGTMVGLFGARISRRS